jgi:hypothetical protein
MIIEDIFLSIYAGILIIGYLLWSCIIIVKKYKEVKS